MNVRKLTVTCIAVGILAWAMPPALAQEAVTLAKYRALKAADRPTVELMLRAMHETAFYVQESVGKSVICASPIPIDGAKMIAMVDAEIERPTNPLRPSYVDNDHLAFIVVNALKNAGVCR